MNIQIYAMKRDFDVQKAERYFKERRIPYQFVDLSKKGMGLKELEAVRRQVGLEAMIRLNDKDDGVIGSYTEMNYLAVVELMQQESGYIMVDVSSSDDFSEKHIEGAVNIPLDDLRARMGELDKSKKYLVSCWVGGRAWNACNILSQNGFDAKNVTGGFCAYHMWVDEG